MFLTLTKGQKKAQLSSVDGLFFVGVAAVVFSIVLTIMWHTIQVHEKYVYTTTLWSNAFLLERATFNTGYPVRYGVSLLKNPITLSQYKLENLSHKSYPKVKDFYGVGEDNFYIMIMKPDESKMVYFYGKMTDDNTVISRRFVMYKGSPVLIRVAFERKPRREAAR